MDVTIQNQRLPALEVNGRYYQTFIPRSAGELIKLHHMGCVGDTVVTDIQLEQGDFPTSFVEPTVTQRSLSGLFKDMRNIELELRDPTSTLWAKIQQTNEGALTQFFKDKVKSAIAQTASEIRTEVADAANKARVQVTADGVIIGSTKITGEQLASTISVSPQAIELIAPKIKVKSDMIVDGAITAAKLSAGAIRSEHIQANAITSKQLMVDLAMAEKLASSEILAKKLFAKEAFINRMQAIYFSANQIKGGVIESLNNVTHFDLVKGILNFKNNNGTNMIIDDDGISLKQNKDILFAILNKGSTYSKINRVARMSSFKTGWDSSIGFVSSEGTPFIEIAPSAKEIFLIPGFKMSFGKNGGVTLEHTFGEYNGHWYTGFKAKGTNRDKLMFYDDGRIEILKG